MEQETNKFAVGIKIFKIQLQNPLIYSEFMHMVFLLNFNSYNKGEQNSKKKYSQD